MATQRKMVNLTVEETSGVDHPAHLHEGWIIKKSANAATVEQAFGTLNTTKEAPVAEVNKNEDGVKPEGSEAPATVTLSQADYDALVAAKAEPAPVVAEGEDAEKALIKSLPEAVQKMLKANEETLAKAQADIAKERDARLDQEVIAKSRDTFKSIALDHGTVAPALRRVALIDPDVAKAVDTALKAADEQLRTAGVITKEIGATDAGSGEGAYGQIMAKARELVANGTVPTVEQGFNKALELSPELYKAYTAEKAGK